MHGITARAGAARPFLLGTDGTAPPRPARRHPDRRGTGVDYLELDLLWGDRGPVARVRLQNSGPNGLVEQVQVFAQHLDARREIGSARVRVPAGVSVTVLVDLDPHFPSTEAWLRRGAAGTPVRVWVGPAITDPRLTVDADL